MRGRIGKGSLLDLGAFLAPVPLVAGGAVVSRTLALPAGAAASRLGVSAFVQTDKGEVLQALALPVCGGG